MLHLLASFTISPQRARAGGADGHGAAEPAGGAAEGGERLARGPRQRQCDNRREPTVEASVSGVLIVDSSRK